MDIVWEDPPERVVIAAATGGGGRYVDFALALREHPMRWALLPGTDRTDKGAKATAQNIRRGKVKGFLRGEYEAAADGTKVYVRFKGTQEPQGDQEPAGQGSAEDPSPPGGRAAQIRAWAQTQPDLDVPRAGRLPQHVIDKYYEAHDGERPSVRMI